jgi:hypothetical protein
MHLVLHAEVHAVFLRVGQPLQAEATIQFLINSLSPCGLFRRPLDLFQDRYPTVLEQTYALLVDIILLHPPELATSAAAGYALSSRAGGDSESTIANLLARIAKMEQRGLPKASARSPRPQPRIQYYCWSHGAMGHNSADCKQPRPGHQYEATASNPMK